MKTVLVYHSSHHGNTKKVAQAIAQGRDVTLIDASAVRSADLSGYELIGFASGINPLKLWDNSAVRAMTRSAPSSWWAASPRGIRTKPTWKTPGAFLPDSRIAV